MGKGVTKRANPSRRKKQALTSHNDGVMRIAFTGEAERNYKFTDLSKDEWHVLGEFIDKTAGRSVTDVNSEYGRKPDKNDTYTDPISSEAKQIQHYKVEKEFRIHGYFNCKGYFTVVRLDPKHKFHHRR